MSAEQAQDAGLIFAGFWRPMLFSFGKNRLDFFRRFALALHAYDGKNAFRNVDFNQVVLFHQSDRTAGLRLRAAVTDDGAGRRAGKTSVRNQRDGTSQFRIRTDSLTGIEHLRHTAALWSFVADENGIALFHLVVENGFQTFFLAFKGTGAEHHVEHFLRTGGVLDDGPFRSQIAVKNGDASVGADGLIKRPDDIVAGQVQLVFPIGGFQPFAASVIKSILPEFVQVFAKRFAGNGHHVQMEHAADLFHDGCRRWKGQTHGR